MLISSPSIDGHSWKTLVLMIFLSLNDLSLQALVFESIPWLLLPGSGSVRLIFLPDIYCCIFCASLRWNGCIPVSFASLVGISTLVQCDVGFYIGILDGRGGSGG